MPINSLLVLDLTLGYLESIDRRPPLARPSLRDSILTKLVAVSRLLKAHFEPLLYSEVFISEGNKQMRPLIKSLRANYGYKSHLVTKLSFVSRHREVDMWSTRSVESIVSRCCAVRRLVIAIPTLFGLDPELLFADSLKGLTSLTLATPFRRLFERDCGPDFKLESLSILAPFSIQCPLSLSPALELLLQLTDVSDDDIMDPSWDVFDCSLSRLKHLDLNDCHSHPLRFVPDQLALTVFKTLEAVALPRFTHIHSYHPEREQASAGIGLGRAHSHPSTSATRYSCDEPKNLHPTREFLDCLSFLSPPDSSTQMKLNWVYLENVSGHIGTIHHLPCTVTHLVIGPSRFADSREVEYFEACLINSDAELEQVGMFLAKNPRMSASMSEHEVDSQVDAEVKEALSRLVTELKEQKRGCAVQITWID